MTWLWALIVYGLGFFAMTAYMYHTTNWPEARVNGEEGKSALICWAAAFLWPFVVPCFAGVIMFVAFHRLLRGWL